jgi:peptidyl-prolyl cis-trans isomerase SurA
LTAKILKSAGFKKAAYDESELYALSDSMLVYKPMGRNVHLTVTSPLFQLGKKNYTVSDWISYAQTFRYKSDGSGIKPYNQLWKEFVEAMAIEFYQANLEQYNEDFRSQIAEFRDGNLFFEIMQQKIWGPAQSDTAALLNYYNRNRGKYNWNKSADAVIFYAPDAVTAKHFSEELKRNPSDWKHIAADHGEQIAADSSRFELAQIPNASKLPLRAGVITEPLVNKADNSTSFAYVLHPYTTGGPRSFAEARGLVINDYQAELEKQWLAELKKKYPVRMNAKGLEMVRKK